MRKLKCFVSSMRIYYSVLSRVLLSVASPMLHSPLSTNTTWPVMAEAKGEHKKAAVCPIYISKQYPEC